VHTRWLEAVLTLTCKYAGGAGLRTGTDPVRHALWWPSAFAMVRHAACLALLRRDRVRAFALRPSAAQARDIGLEEGTRPSTTLRPRSLRAQSAVTGSVSENPARGGLHREDPAAPLLLRYPCVQRGARVHVRRVSTRGSARAAHPAARRLGRQRHSHDRTGKPLTELAQNPFQMDRNH